MVYAMVGRLCGAAMNNIQKAALIAYSKTAGYRNKVADTRRVIGGYPQYAISISWGKDSVVMLHLACRALDKVVAVYGRFSENEEIPDIPSVRDHFLSSYGERICYREVRIRGFWDIFEEAGRFFTVANAAEIKIIQNQHDEMVRSIENAATECGAIGMMIGLRSSESHARKMNILSRGNHYIAKGRIPTLLPMAGWTSKDILAYHIENDIQWLRIYDVASDPGRARSEFVFAGSAAEPIRRHGAWHEWKEAYPELWKKWQLKWGITL